MAVGWRRNFRQNLGTGLAFDYGRGVVSVQCLHLNSFPWPGIGSLFDLLEPWFGGISLVYSVNRDGALRRALTYVPSTR